MDSNEIKSKLALSIRGSSSELFSQLRRCCLVNIGGYQALWTDLDG